MIIDIANYKQILMKLVNDSGLPLTKLSTKAGLSKSVVSRFYTGESSLTALSFLLILDALGKEVVLLDKDRRKPTKASSGYCKNCYYFERQGNAGYCEKIGRGINPEYTCGFFEGIK